MLEPDSGRNYRIAKKDERELVIEIDTKKPRRQLKIVFLGAIGFGIFAGSLFVMYNLVLSLIGYLGVPLGFYLIGIFGPFPKTVIIDRLSGALRIVYCFAFRKSERIKEFQQVGIDDFEMQEFQDRETTGARLRVHAPNGRQALVYWSSDELVVQEVHDIIIKFLGTE
nr:hypothetical protein [Candidatus Sigynarchaeota archaeon]